ncbi:unnamed protein product [Pelagomonas calceolata]|uniref:Uncharacterized protein n=3 Tax=Pelagomonas calceolata TaxID=35677 RepID=A0A8J2SQM1_9STRA|nr:unnamed protein product [Pelagomonas calceolata]
MPLSVNTHESAALYQSMAANLRKAHGTMREVLEAPDRAATLPGEAPDRAATLPKPSTKVTFASAPDKENASPAYQPRKASPPPARAAAATPTTVASFGEEGADATPDAPPKKTTPKPAPAAKAPVAAKPEKPAEPTKPQQPPAAWAAALAKKKAPPSKKNAKAAPAPTVYRSGWSESQGSDAHRAAGGTQAHGFGGSPYAADPLRFLPKAAAAPAAPQRVGKFKWPPSPEKPSPPKAAPQTPGFDETAPDVSPEFKARKAPAAAPASVYRSGWSAALPAAAPREGPAACASPGPGTPSANSLEAAEPLEAAMDSISPLTDEARSLAEGVAAASPAVESPADAGAVYPESPADPGAVFPASPAEDDGVVDEGEEEDEVDELEAEKTWPSSDGSKAADEPPAPEAAWARVARRRSCARRASVEHGRSPRAAPAPGAGWAGAWDVLRDALERGASVGAAAESLAAESSVVLSDAQKEDFCDLMAARDFGSCDEHPEDFPSRELAVEFVEDVKAKAKISDGVAARESGGSTDLSGLFASVDELGPDLQTALAAATEVPSEEVAEAPTKKPSARSLRRAVVAAIRTVAAEHLAPRVVSYDEATGLYGVDCRITVEDGSVVRMAVERDFTDFVRCRAGLVEKLATTAHGRTLVGKLNKVPKKRVRSLLKAKARDAVQGGGAGETKWQRKQRPRLQRWLDSAVIVVRDCKRAERYATQPFGAGDAEDIALETEDYFKCFLLQGAVYRGLDAIDPIIDVNEL